MNRASVVLSFLALISGGHHANRGYAQVNEDWVQTYNGWYAASVVTNSAGEIYVTGPTYQDAAHNFNYDIILAKYDMHGNEVWSLEFDETDDATNGQDKSNWIALDPSGNVLLTGTSFINTSGDDFFTMKYDPDGNLVWKVRSMSGLEASRVETDEDGNVYVMGPSSTVASGRNYVTIKYNPGGVQQWVKTYNGPNSFDDNPASLAVTADGRVAVTGGSTGGITSFDFATILYDTDGNVLWTQRYDSEEYADRGEDVTFGPGGEVYAAGHAYDPDDGYTDAVLIKYDAAGNEVWVREYDGGMSDTFRRVRVDSEGNIVATGYVQKPSFYTSFLTVKYDQNGTLLWSEELPLSSSDDLVWSMAIGSADDVFLTGESGGDVMTLKYNSDGILQWTQSYPGGTFVNRGRSISLDPFGGIVVAGESPFLTIRYSEGQPVGMSCDDIFFFNAKCNSNGAAQSMVKATGDWSGTTVTFDLDGEDIVSTVNSNGTNSIAKMTVPHAGMGSHTVTLEVPGGCYEPVTFNCQVDAPPDPVWDALWAEAGRLEELKEGRPAEVSITSSYPNPFNPSTTVTYTLKEDAMVNLSVFNTLGQRVKTLVNGFVEAGYRTATWNGTNESGQSLAGGVYFLRLEASGSLAGVRRIVFLK